MNQQPDLRQLPNTARQRSRLLFAPGSSSSSSRCSSRWRPLLLSLLVCALLPAHTHAAHVHANTAMRDHIRKFVSAVPLERDYLGEMSEALRSAWSQDLGLTINETLGALSEARLPIKVDVKLIGFAGDGNEGLHISDHDLLLFLKSLHNQLDSVALHPSTAHMTVKPEIQFRVLPAYYELAGKVAGAINQAINQGQTSNAFTPYFLHIVPYQDVDKVIQEDFRQGDGSFTIYLLNPPSHAPYAYFYHGSGEVKDACPGSLWVGSQRYVWFDLTANLTFYGPGPGGKGQVFAHSTPLLKHYKKETISKAILPDLAALVWSACQHLVWPPMHHGKLAVNKQLEVHLIYMVEALMRPTYGDGRVKVAELQTELQAIGKEVYQDVAVTEHYVLFAECDHCVTAYAGALKARTSRDPAAKTFKLSASHYLDLPELERWLLEWKDALMSEAGVTYDAAHESTHVLPVFIFDVPSAEPVLLDGLLQAAVLGTGEVVAVRSSNAKPLATFFGCFEQQMSVNPRDIHRPVLAATIQSAYGVADTALSWSQATGKTWSFVWSVGQTPFCPLSNVATLSFAQKEAALRNLALSYLNSSMVHAAALIRGFQMLAPDGHLRHVKQFLQPEMVIPYQQRIALLLFKLKESLAALGSQHHTLAVGYAASTVQDVLALHKITKQYKATLNPDLVCVGRDAPWRWWLLPAGCVFLTLLLVVWRCARGSPDAEPDSKNLSRRSSITSHSFGGHHRAY